jgi:hypothetical protein
MRELQSMRELRGVPIVGRGRSSAILGSDPLRYVLDKERRGRLNLSQRDPLPALTSEVRARWRPVRGRRVTAPEGRMW